jgi:hypothetical protein
MTQKSFSAGLAGVFTAALVAFSMLSATAADARARGGQDRHVRIINETSRTITRFYASNIAVNSWQEDILGDDVLKPGQDVNINIDDGTGHCKYDFKAVFDNGRSLVKHNINVCQITSYRYTD